MPKQIKSFSGLRFLAAIIIFLTHYFSQIGGAPNQALANAANFNFVVTFFFILSGFCTTLGYGNKFTVLSKQGVVTYLKKRLFKLYPIYALSNIIVAIIIIVAVPETKNIIATLACIPAALTFLQSLTVLHPIMLNSPSWFIATLFFCYLATPYLLNKTENNSFKKNFLGIAICFAILGSQIGLANLMNYQTPLDHFCKDSNFWHSFLYTNPLSRFFEYAIGCFFARIMVQSKAKQNSIAMSVFEVFAITMCAAAFFNGKFNYESIEMSLFYIPGILVLIYAFAFDKGVASKFLGNKVFNYLGNLSMVFYLLHFPIIVLLAKHMNGFLIFAITIAVSAICDATIQKLFSTAAKNGKAPR